MASRLMILRAAVAQRFIVASASPPKCRAASQQLKNPCSFSMPSVAKDLKFCSVPSTRRVHGVVAMGQSLMPWYSATASASLVSRLQIDGIPLQGRFSGYVSPI